MAGIEIRVCDNAGMDSSAALCNHLLIAMPGMADPNFNSTVTLVCEHNDDGALGIVINRPMPLSFAGLFEQLDLVGSNPEVADQPVLDGGPVAKERGFVLHNPGGRFESSVAVSPEVQLTMSRDVIDALAAGTGPAKAIIALGYAGWGAGQLEQEILGNTWLTVPATPEIIFDVPFEERWRIAAKTIGIDISQLSSDAGHA